MEDTIKYDCFAFRSKKDKDSDELIYDCDALNKLYCECEKNCKFYKKGRR